MLTLEGLKECGAHVDEGLGRCVGSQDLYFKLVGMMVKDKNFDKLGEEVENNNLQEAFEAAHSLKGASANLALNPLTEALSNIVEPLRRREADFDYKGAYQKVLEAKAVFQNLVEN